MENNEINSIYDLDKFFKEAESEQEERNFSLKVNKKSHQMLKILSLKTGLPMRDLVSLLIENYYNEKIRNQ